MCICINCDYYSSCWMQKGIRIVKLKDQNKANFSKIKYYYSNFPRVFIKVHLFNEKYFEEFDVTNCENFCESPGEWIT